MILSWYTMWLILNDILLSQSYARPHNGLSYAVYISQFTERRWVSPQSMKTVIVTTVKLNLVLSGNYPIGRLELYQLSDNENYIRDILV